MNEPAAQNNDPLEDPIDDPLTGHNYDGIQEYDNPMPGWWKMLFVLTIIYAFPYMYYYHGAKADRSIHTAYDEAVAANLRLQFAEIGELQPNAETILEYSEDDKWLQVGKTVFKTHCISCHGENGLGKVGPNLTDDLWKNVKTVEDIAKVVIEGANNNAMPAWQHRLHPNEVVLVSSYVASLRGTQPGQKGKVLPEEKPIPPWGTSSSSAESEPETPDAGEPAAEEPETNGQSAET